MRNAFVGLITLAVIIAPAVAAPEPLQQRLAVGQRLNTIFSKTVSISGPDFDPIVKRTSGSATDEIQPGRPGEIVEDESYLYDGRPSGRDRVTVRDHGQTNCVAGKCQLNDSTSAPTFNPFLWGNIPHRLAAGSTWRAKIGSPWEIGPAGEQTVRVIRYDRRSGLITLRREGRGTGQSSDDRQSGKMTLVSHGQSVEARVDPGPATWEGTATFLHGITIADEIVVTRHVRLVAIDGRTFEADERIYTVFTEA